MILGILFILFFLWIFNITLLYICLKVKYPHYTDFIHEFIYTLKEDHILVVLFVGSPFFVVLFSLLFAALIIQRLFVNKEDKDD